MKQACLRDAPDRNDKYNNRSMKGAILIEIDVVFVSVKGGFQSCYNRNLFYSMILKQCT